MEIVLRGFVGAGCALFAIGLYGFAHDFRGNLREKEVISGALFSLLASANFSLAGIGLIVLAIAIKLNW